MRKGHASFVFIVISLFVAIIGVLGAVILKAKLVEIVGPQSAVGRLHWIHLGDFVCGALIVFGVTLALGEMGALSPYFKKQIMSVFTDLMTDREFLWKNLSPEIIRSLRASSIFALCKEHKDKSSPFFGLIENDILPMLDQATREDHKIFYEHKPVTVNGNQMLEVTRTDEFLMKNPTREFLTYVQRMKLHLQKIEGVSVFKELRFEVDGKPTPFPLKQIDESDQVITYIGEESLVIKDSLKILFELNITVPFNDHFAVWELYPTHGISVSYQHPPNFEPQLFLFALSDAGPLLKPTHIARTRDHHVWEYDGWLLQKHGIVLTWKVKGGK